MSWHRTALKLEYMIILTTVIRLSPLQYKVALTQGSEKARRYFDISLSLFTIRVWFFTLFTVNLVTSLCVYGLAVLYHWDWGFSQIIVLPGFFVISPGEQMSLKLMPYMCLSAECISISKQLPTVYRCLVVNFYWEVFHSLFYFLFVWFRLPWPLLWRGV